MLRKNVLVALATVGFVAVSCSDDNSKSNNIDNSTNALVGTWKAETLSYDVPGVHSGTYPFDHQMIKMGCGTDYLELKADKSSKLTENNKVTGADGCEDVNFMGTWTDDKILLDGKAERKISSIVGDTLTLVYPYQFGNFPEIDITVKYSRQ